MDVHHDIIEGTWSLCATTAWRQSAGIAGPGAHRAVVRVSIFRRFLVFLVLEWSLPLCGVAVARRLAGAVLHVPPPPFLPACIIQCSAKGALRAPFGANPLSTNRFLIAPFLTDGRPPYVPVFLTDGRPPYMPVFWTDGRPTYVPVFQAPATSATSATRALFTRGYANFTLSAFRCSWLAAPCTGSTTHWQPHALAARRAFSGTHGAHASRSAASSSRSSFATRRFWLLSFCCLQFFGGCCFYLLNLPALSSDAAGVANLCECAWPTHFLA